MQVKECTKDGQYLSVTKALMLKILLVASTCFLRVLVVRCLHSLNAYQSFKHLAVGSSTLLIKGRC